MSSISLITRFSPAISFYTPDIFMHALSCRMHDFSCYTPHLISWSQRWQSGGGRFCLVLLCKGRKWGSCFCFFSGCTIWLRIFSVVLQQTLCSCLRGRCAVRVFFRCDDTVARHRSFTGYPVHQNQLWANYFGHFTPAELHGTSTLWHFDPHMFSDLVRAVVGTREHYRMTSPLHPNFILIDPVGRCNGGWYVVSGCDVIPVDSVLYGTVHPGCNLFHCAVTSLRYGIPSWQIMLAKSYLANCFQLKKHDGPQSVSVKKCCAL